MYLPTRITMSIINHCFLLLVLLCSANIAFAHGKEKHHEMTPPDSLAISVAFDHAGRLWRVGVSDGFVEVSSSNDLGKTFSNPVKVNPDKQKITAHGEIRPKIAIGKDNQIYVTWMQNLPTRFSGHIWFARSIDGGKHFERPYVVHQDRDEIGHAFEELVVSPDGRVTVLWLDSRDLVKAKQTGQKHTGSSIYYAVSKDAGATFQKEQKLADHTCECCRIASAVKPDGTVVAMWRHVFEGQERDHMIAEVPSPGANKNVVSKRATFDRWQIDGCPHHGPALISGGEGKDWWGFHMGYFDGNEKDIKDPSKYGPGLYYSRMDGVMWSSTPGKKFADSAQGAGHPAILSLGPNVYYVWQEKSVSGIKIMLKTSNDEGRSWGQVTKIAQASGKADYPYLLQHQSVGYLAWNVQTAAGPAQLQLIKLPQ